MGLQEVAFSGNAFALEDTSMTLDSNTGPGARKVCVFVVGRPDMLMLCQTHAAAGLAHQVHQTKPWCTLVYSGK